ncbi:MAG: histidine kinase [Siphonobacter sp.]
MSAAFPVRISKPWRIIIQPLFWGLFVAWPLLVHPPGPEPNHKPGPPPDSRYLVLLNVIAALFFYLNTRILIPRFLEKKGLGVYLAVVAGSVIVMIGISNLIRWLAFGPIYIDFRFISGSVFSTILIFSLSTTYKVLNDFHRRQQLEKERENERLKSELSFLRSQISPHFLFNVLNSIVSLARFRPADVESATIQLAELLRYMLYESDGERVLITKEINYLRSYVDLQTLRLGKKVQVVFQVESEHNPGSIEPMLLIPFVENAFKHGIGMIRNPKIIIRLKVEGEQLFFKVCNQISQQHDDPKDNRSGIGLRNVERRLSLLYPEHQLLVQQGEDWFEIDLTLKLR